MRSYICSVNRTTLAPQIDRRKVLAASADAAWCWYVSTATTLVSETVRIDRGKSHTKIVVCRVVQEDEAKPDWPASNGRSKPMNSWIRGPGKDEQSNRNEPARNHHRNQALFRRGFSVVLRRHLEVVLVDKRCAGSTHNDSNGKGNEHETSGPSTPSFTVLVHDRVAERIVKIRAD